MNAGMLHDNHKIHTIVHLIVMKSIESHFYLSFEVMTLSRLGKVALLQCMRLFVNHTKLNDVSFAISLNVFLSLSPRSVRYDVRDSKSRHSKNDDQMYVDFKIHCFSRSAEYANTKE